MIYIGIVLFILPLLLKTIQGNGFTIKILFPTLVTYSIWFLLSYFFILININIHYYLYIFIPFPFVLLIYEIGVTYIKRKELVFNKYLIYFSLFILINLLITIFKYEYLEPDNKSYMKWAIDAFQNNKFISNDAYKYNSFYYIATIFGDYNIPVFYNTLSTYIFGSIMYVFIVLILQLKFKNLMNIPAQIIMIILIAGYNNTPTSANLNWSVGVVSILGLLYLTTIVFSSKYKLIHIIAIDALLIFLFNFGLTAIVVSVLVIMVLKIIIIIKEWNLLYISFGLFYLFYLYNYKFGSTLNAIVISIFIITIISSAIIVFISSKSKITYEQRKISRIFSNLSKKYDVKKNYLNKFIILNIILMFFSILIFVIDKHWNDEYWIQHTIYMITTIILINLACMYKYYELILILLILYLTSLFYMLIIRMTGQTIIVYYLVNRVQYAYQIIGVIFVPIFSIWLLLKINFNKTMIIHYLQSVVISAFGLSVLSFALNPNANLLILRFSFHSPTNNISQNNYNFIEKYDDEIFSKNTFSSYDLPFVKNTPIWRKNLYYNGKLTEQGVSPRIPFFQRGNGAEKRATLTLNEMYKKVETERFYNLVIVDKGAKLLRSALFINNMTAQYTSIDHNSDLQIWRINP